MKLDAKFTAALQEIEATRGVSRERILEALVEGVQAAWEKTNGTGVELEVEINLQSGIIEAFLVKRVVELVTDPKIEISLDRAREYNAEAELGDTIDLPADISSLGNLAIHTFKQRVKSLIRDAERDKVVDLYGSRLYELINCTVLYTERGDLYVETPDKIEGIIPYEDQIPRERPQPGQRLKALLIEVRNVRKAPMLRFSRTHPDLLRELMKNEIPEVREGNIEIVSIARDPGHRAKVAVRTNLTELDPVGSCIGSRGIRITAISHEVNDEKIDLVLYKEDPFEFIAEALSPAKVMSVEIFEGQRRALVIVPDDQISLAIGKGWRNVKLASKLTRYKLDVKSVSEMEHEQGYVFEEDDDADSDLPLDDEQLEDGEDDTYVDEPPLIGRSYKEAEEEPGLRAPDQA
jgi:transcription termination/antitermination protein NusA